MNGIVLASRISGLPHRSRIDAVAAAVASRDARAFDPAGAAALFDVLETSTQAEARSALAALDALAGSATILYLRARLYGSLKEPATAAACWTEFFAMTPCRDSLVLLHAARAYAAAGMWVEAATRLRDALAERPDYTFHARAHGILQQVSSHASRGVRRARVAILGSATTSLFLPIVKALSFRDRIDVECYEGLYGAFRQEILDPDSGLHRFAPDVVFIVPTWRDLNLRSFGTEQIDTLVEAAVGEYVTLWEALARHSHCHIVQHSFDIPRSESAGGLAARAGGRRRLIRRINLRLGEVAPAFVSILDTERVIAEIGIHAWEDAALWHRARQHPSPRALPALVEQQMAHLRAALGLARKVVVCDLDNTLWGGVIGEDGLEGIRVGGSSPEGEAYAELQKYLTELRDRGVLLAVSSKNNPEDARLPFAHHSGMVLRLEDFAAFEANWDDKVTNLRRVAERLSLGTDSFVFLDDNPFERAWVRSQMPEVAVVELGPSPATRVRDLDSGRYFEVVAISEEDRTRAELYQRETARDALRAQVGTLDEFLARLHMEGTATPVSGANLARVTQLVNKTNQFNLTTRRYTEAQIRALVARGAWCGAYELSDRFGRHGIVGVLLCVPGESTDAWEIDTWLMSCRVLGRQFERFMFDRTVDAARAAGVERIIGTYCPTAKNGLVSDLFERFGFTRREQSEENGTRYELALNSVTAPYTTFIQVAGGKPIAADAVGAPGW
jgi:FkbH-like protein